MTFFRSERRLFQLVWKDVESKSLKLACLALNHSQPPTCVFRSASVRKYSSLTQRCKISDYQCSPRVSLRGINHNMASTVHSRKYRNGSPSNGLTSLVMHAAAMTPDTLASARSLTRQRDLQEELQVFLDRSIAQPDDRHCCMIRCDSRPKRQRTLRTAGDWDVSARREF